MENYNEDIQLKDILVKLLEYRKYIFKKKFTILSFGFLFSLIGILIAINSETIYDAELTFVVELEKGEPSLGAMSGVASQFGFDLGSGSSETFSKKNILELLKSRGVVESALMQGATINNRQDLLIEHYIIINGIKKAWDKDEAFDGISFHDDNTYTHDSIRGVIWNSIIENNLSVDMQNDKANIINLSYKSTNPNYAKYFVEALIDEMSRMYTEHKTAQARVTLDFLKNRADSVFMELESSEQEFARVKDINQRIVKASGRLKELQLMRRVEVLNTMYLEIVKNLELSKITLLNKTPIIQVIDNPILPLKEQNSSAIIMGILGAFIGILLSIFFFVFRKLFKDALEGR